MQIEPQKQHLWLQRLVGDWQCDGEAATKPGEPPVKWQSRENVRAIGGLWVLAEGHGEMPGCGESTTLMTLGFDPQKGRFVGTWAGSMMTHLWIYEGALDAAGKVLTLETEGPDCTAAGKVSKYRDVIEIRSDDERTLISHMQGDDGEWRKLMSSTFRRIR